jgi:two-component system sensor histidine kinase KdpD
MAKGTLRIYLGAAPGVGKTFDMLNEGRRRAERGTDVVIGLVETHGRVKTLEQIGGLEIVPRREVEYRGTVLEEMDLDAVLARAPAVALVDELAHTNAPGSRHAKRWEDIEELLDAGIDVISTVNIQHLESLNDVVEGITGITQRETVPDSWVRSADQIELVDSTPEALRRRMAHGNIYPAERIDAALGNYFREGNLSALRELALLWVADRVDEALTEYRVRHGIKSPWETRERVMVAITGAPGGEHLVRRAARMATRARADLVGVHIRADDGVLGPSEDLLDEHRVLLSELGGRYIEASGGDVSQALLDTARAEQATQLVIGASRRSRWAEITSGSVVNRIIRAAGSIDVHVISTEETDHEQAVSLPHSRKRVVLPPRRKRLAWALAIAGPPVLTLLLSSVRDHIGLPSVLLLFLLVVVGAAALGGTGPALVTAITSSLYANWFFFPPIHSWTINDRDNVLALVVFVIIGIVVSWFVATVARRSADAARARAEAETLVRLVAATASADPLGTVIEHLRDALSLDAVAVLSKNATGWTIEAAAGTDPPADPSDADEVVDLEHGVVLAIRGRDIAAEDRHVMHAFASQLEAAVRSRRLTKEVATAAEISKVNELRSALLAAVSHDLRTPLASIKASVTSLLADDVQWSPEAVRDFCVAIDEETDRLAALVANLLDMSRLTSGALSVHHARVGVEEIVPAALASLGDRARHGRVAANIPETLPRIDTDPALLERAVANLIDNAIAWSPPESAVRVEAGAVASEIHLRVIDRGPGIPVADRERVFQPFQRSGDRSNGAGVGLGLAVAQGFIRAVGSDLYIEDTPGGGTTMVVTMPVER